MKIENYYLDLKKVFELSCLDDRDRIHSYYSDMLFQNTVNGDKNIAKSYFLTLTNSGFLIDSRDEKLETLLSE